MRPGPAVLVMGCRGWHLAGREIARLYFSRGHMGSVWLLLCAHGDGLCALWIWGRECLGVSFTFCPHIVSAGVRYRVHAVTTSVAGGCVKPSVGSSSAPAGNNDQKRNEQKRTALDVCLCATADRAGPAPGVGVLSARRGMTRSRRWELLLVMLLAAVGGSRPARATAVAAGRKRSGPLNVFIMRIQPPMCDEP